MSEPANHSLQGEVDTPRSAARLSKFSLWMGILAVLPYLPLLFFILMPILNINRIIQVLGVHDEVFLSLLFLPVYLFSAVCGIPFGLAGIVGGILGLTRRPETKRLTVYALLGIVLGIGGVIGHIWYITSR